jgi:hypothetical protein
MSDMSTVVEINKDSYKELKRLYNQAVANQVDSFTFMGKVVLVSYAKYLLEYLKPNFE